MGLDPGSNFVKLLSRKYRLTKFFAKQKLSGAPVTTMSNFGWQAISVKQYFSVLSVFVLTSFMKLGTDNLILCLALKLVPNNELTKPIGKSKQPTWSWDLNLHLCINAQS